ncbi:MAG: glycosyltransferase family 4 protein [Planctomycetota bacterium]|jgi:glycosyltransferase involved in cell wall biosynthesis
MKILHVHDFFAPGNSRYGFDMDRMLVGRGHTVHVLAGTGEMGPENGAVVEGITFHTYPYAFEEGGAAKYRYGLRQNAERFTKLQGEHGFDLAILNQPLCASGVLRSGAAKSVSRVYSFISSWPEEWKAGNPGAGFLRRWINYGFRRKMERRALEAADAVIVESRFIESLLRRVHPRVDPSRVHMIYGAVDMDRFAAPGTRQECRRRLGLPEDGTVLLTLRRLVARMGIENLLRALEGFPKVRLVVGGDGPLKPGLERLAGDLGMKDRVRFHGYVRDEDMAAIYTAADLFVLPTLALEGFGLVAIEAMACGTPAAGTPVGAIPEVLGDFDPRALFPGTQAGEIAEGLSKLLGDAEVLPALGARSREYVAARFDWKKTVEQVEKVLEDALH